MPKKGRHKKINTVWFPFFVAPKCSNATMWWQTSGQRSQGYMDIDRQGFLSLAVRSFPGLWKSSLLVMGRSHSNRSKAETYQIIHFRNLHLCTYWLYPSLNILLKLLTKKSWRVLLLSFSQETMWFHETESHVPTGKTCSLCFLLCYSRNNKAYQRIFARISWGECSDLNMIYPL